MGKVVARAETVGQVAVAACWLVVVGAAGGMVALVVVGTEEALEVAEAQMAETVEAPVEVAATETAPSLRLGCMAKCMIPCRTPRAGRRRRTPQPLSR